MTSIKTIFSGLLQTYLGAFFFSLITGTGTAIMGYIEAIPCSYIIFLVLGVVAFTLIILAYYQENITVRRKLINTSCKMISVPKINNTAETNSHVSMVFCNSSNRKIFFRSDKFRSTVNKSTDQQNKKIEIHLILPKQTHTVLGPAVEHQKSESNRVEIEWEGVYGTSEKNMCYSLAVSREMKISKENNLNIIDSTIAKYED